MDDVGSFKVKAEDGQTLFGHIWDTERPLAVMSLVHGFGEHAARYAGMASYLNEHRIAVVAIDLHGHGRTTGKRGVINGMGDFRADLAALLEKTRALYPNVPHFLYGHSMGGGIVLDHGLTPAPDLRGIIASAPLIALAKPVPAPLRGLVKLLGKIFPKGAMGQPIDGTKVSTIKAEQELYEQDPLNHGRMGFRTAAAIVENGEAVAAQASQWRLPALLLHARKDELTDFAVSEKFAMIAPNMNFMPFEHCAHEMHNDKPRAAVYKAMRDFILGHIA
jgi:alpha-beta hydrolase superfamily lysophospholipase